MVKDNEYPPPDTCSPPTGVYHYTKHCSDWIPLHVAVTTSATTTCSTLEKDRYLIECCTLNEEHLLDKERFRSIQNQTGSVWIIHAYIQILVSYNSPNILIVLFVIQSFQDWCNQLFCWQLWGISECLWHMRFQNTKNTQFSICFSIGKILYLKCKVNLYLISFAKLILKYFVIRIFLNQKYYDWSIDSLIDLNGNPTCLRKSPAVYLHNYIFVLLFLKGFSFIISIIIIIIITH